jgi:hypothetical protein
MGRCDENDMIRAVVIPTIKRRGPAWEQQEHSSRFRPLVKVAPNSLRVIKQRLEETDVPERVVF